MDLARENPKIAAVMGFWAALMAVGVMTACYFHFTYISHVSERQKEVQGTIEPPVSGRGSFYYKFTASKGDEYHGMSRRLSIEPYPDGQAVSVFYDPKYPYTNSLIPYSTSTFPDGFIAAAAGCVAVGAVIYGLVMWRRTPVRP